MAFNIYFKVVENNPHYPTKATPWRCDKCHKEQEVLLRMKVDYDTVVLCKECLTAMKKEIMDKEKELEDGNRLCE